MRLWNAKVPSQLLKCTEQKKNESKDRIQKNYLFKRPKKKVKFLRKQRKCFNTSKMYFR